MMVAPQEPSTQQLYRGSTVLTDTQTLAELGVHDDDELGLALKKQGGRPGGVLQVPSTCRATLCH